LQDVDIQRTKHIHSPISAWQTTAGYHSPCCLFICPHVRPDQTPARTVRWWRFFGAWCSATLCAWSWGTRTSSICQLSLIR